MRNTPGITTLIGILICGSIGVAAAQSGGDKSGSEGSAAESAVASPQVEDTLPGAPDTTGFTFNDTETKTDANLLLGTVPRGDSSLVGTDHAIRLLRRSSPPSGPSSAGDM